MEPISEKFENRLKIFGEVMDKGLVSCFFDSQCSYKNVTSKAGQQ